MYLFINDTEFERLKKANQLKKYGHLQSWKELFAYQKYIASHEQVLEIASLAKRKNNGEGVKLPLMNWYKEQKFI